MCVCALHASSLDGCTAVADQHGAILRLAVMHYICAPKCRKAGQIPGEHIIIRIRVINLLCLVMIS